MTARQLCQNYRYLISRLTLLPKSRRRNTLTAAFEKLLEEYLEYRVLAFDNAAALETAQLAAQRQKNGRPVDIRDTQIAGNVRHFEDLSGSMINPWN